jgi:hypothetical protein
LFTALLTRFHDKYIYVPSSNDHMTLSVLHFLRNHIRT